MRDGEVPAELWSANVHPVAAPAWVMLLVGQSAKNLVFFSVRPGPGPQYLLLGPDTTDGTVCVFEDGPLRRLVVLCDSMATRAPVAGRSGIFRRFNIRRLFRLGISNEAWVRSAALLDGRPRFSAHMTARRLFVGPSGDLEDDAALLARVREVLDVTHFEVGVLPPPGVLVPLLLDPLLPPERGALRSGAYRPDLAPGGPPAAAAATRISDDGQTVVFGDFLTAVTALGPLFGAAARGFVAAGEMARICRRQDLELDDIPETLAWTAADADGRHPTAVPIRVAHELLRHAAVRFLRRWAARILALLEGAVAPPVYSVQRKSSTSAPPGEAYTGRGRRVSVSAPATSPDGAASQGDFTLVMDETGEATGLVPSDALVEIPMEPGCPGAGLDPNHKVHAEKMLGGDDGGRGVTLSAAGLVSVLPLCMTSQYRDPVTNAAVALTDLRRYFLSKVLWGLRRDPAQRKQYAALLRSDVAAQGALQRGRMAQAVTRTRAAGAIRPCAGCAFSNWQTCYRELYDGKVGGAVPTPRPDATVVDLVLEVKGANAAYYERLQRAAAQQAAARARHAATPGAGSGGRQTKRPAPGV